MLAVLEAYDAYATLADAEREEDVACAAWMCVALEHKIALRNYKKAKEATNIAKAAYKVAAKAAGTAVDWVPPV